MAEYYVVRDKNTGLYFRGKGVNRWGKYYNQASIYRIKANAENTIKEVSWRGEQAEIVPIQIVETTADVVPKSEVARLQEDVDRLQEINNRQVENIKLAKAEVAREIFEEIESVMYDRFSNIMLGEDIRLCIAELKKKYTEATDEV